MGVLVDPRHIQETWEIGDESFVVGMIFVVGEGFGIVNVSQFFRTPRCSAREATPVLDRPLPTFARCTCRSSKAPTPLAVAGADRAEYHAHFWHYFQFYPKGRGRHCPRCTFTVHVKFYTGDCKSFLPIIWIDKTSDLCHYENACLMANIVWGGLWGCLGQELFEPVIISQQRFRRLIAVFDFHIFTRQPCAEPIGKTAANPPPFFTPRLWFWRSCSNLRVPSSQLECVKPSQNRKGLICERFVKASQSPRSSGRAGLHSSTTLGCLLRMMSQVTLPRKNGQSLLCNHLISQRWKKLGSRQSGGRPDQVSKGVSAM